jgi:pSer/pThr/pTyr-binding forkhead associated (FHA) protein
MVREHGTPSGSELVLLDGSAQRFPLDEGCELTIGTSAGCSLRLSAVDVSRTHAMITCLRGVVTVLDLGSTNGTFVNGRRVREAQLAAGDVIRFSSVIAQVVPSGSPSSGSIEVERDPADSRQTAMRRDSGSVSGEVPIILQDSLLWLLRRWSMADSGSLVALVEWFVARRGMRGAALAEIERDEAMVRAAHGGIAGVLDDPRLAAVLRAAGASQEGLQSIQVQLGGCEVVAVHTAGAPCLLILPGRSMPSGEDLELYAALLRVGQRLDATGEPPRPGMQSASP